MSMRFDNVLNNRKLPMPGDKFDADFDEESDKFRHLLSLKMKEEMMSDEERTAPDTFGCDCLFLEHFITDEMRSDFSLIARDFLMHEYPNIKDHEKVYYLETDAAENWPERMFERFILNMMMNAVNYGSQYTKNLFLYLYKTYYSKEYKQLKRFSSLSNGELMSLASNGHGGTNGLAMARILFISKLSGIEIKPDCNFAYLFLDDIHKNDEDDMEPDWGFMDSVVELFQTCRDENEQRFKDTGEMYDLHYKCGKFLENVLRSEGYPEDYVMLCNNMDHGIARRLARTLAVLKKTYKNKEFTKEELIIYSSIYEAAEALICSTEEMEARMNEVFYGEKGTDYYDAFPPKFCAGDIPQAKSGTANTVNPVKNDRPDDKAGEGSPRYKEEALLKEIDALRLKIHEQEGNIKVLKGDLSRCRNIAEENKRLKDRLDYEYTELVVLRDHVYNLTEEDNVSDEIPVEDMKIFLKELRIIIIGGHKNWRRKMKQEFPDWTYVDASVSGTLEASIVDNADYVYFFTDTISHSTYFKYMNVVKEHGVNFGYIHGVNIENNVRKIYKDQKKGS